MVVLNQVLILYPVVHILLEARRQLGHVRAGYAQSGRLGEGQGSRFESRL